jgi:Uma2 family endonuclease
MATDTRTITADELLAMPEDGLRRELVEGELREMTPAGRRHARVARNILRSLDDHVVEHGLGEVYPEYGYVLSRDPDTVRAPDVSFLRRDRLERGGEEEGYFPGVPDLAVEVVSPSDRFSAVSLKVDEYLEAGTPMVVLVDPPQRSVIVYRSRTGVTVLTEDDVLDGGDVVPGWRLPVRDVFA